MTTYCLHCGLEVGDYYGEWVHSSNGAAHCDGKGPLTFAEPAPWKRLQVLELAAAYWMAAYHLAQAKPGEKVHKARELLTLQRFRDHPHHDEETR